MVFKMLSEKISFKVMVTYSEVLEIVIEKYNDYYNTDFKITEISDDQVAFCTIEATQYQLKDIFGLGYCLSIEEYRKREKGELVW